MDLVKILLLHLHHFMVLLRRNLTMAHFPPKLFISSTHVSTNSVIKPPESLFCDGQDFLLLLVRMNSAQIFTTLYSFSS